MIDRDAYNEMWVEEKRKNHVENVLRFTGRWHGRFFVDGEGQQKKEPTGADKGSHKLRSIAHSPQHLDHWKKVDARREYK